MDHFITSRLGYSIDQILIQIMIVSFTVYFLAVIGQAIQTKQIIIPICVSPISWPEIADASQLPFLVVLALAGLFIAIYLICAHLGLFEKRIVCPTCHMHGIKSTVQEGASWSEAVHYPTLYDKTGRRGKVPAYRMTTEYQCSNGHRFEQTR